MNVDRVYAEVSKVADDYNTAKGALSSTEKILIITLVDHLLKIGEPFKLNDIRVQQGGWGEIEYHIQFSGEKYNARASVTFWPHHTVTGLYIHMAHFKLVNRTMDYTVDTRPMVLDQWLKTHFTAITKLAKDQPLVEASNITF